MSEIANLRTDNLRMDQAWQNERRACQYRDEKSLILDIWYVKMFMKNASGEGDILHVPELKKVL